MLCVYCNSDIENDNFHCDQCGKELFICPTCNRPGKGKNCVHDGCKLISPKQQSASGNSTNPTSDNSPILQSKSILGTASQPVVSNTSQIPILKISNPALKIDIEINNGDIIGSTNGRFIKEFENYKQVSGTHAKFIFDLSDGWAVVDIGSTGAGSTNGTKVSNSPNWQSMPPIQPNTPTVLKNNSLLLIANIEFQVKIILPQTATGTQRL